MAAAEAESPLLRYILRQAMRVCGAARPRILFAGGAELAAAGLAPLLLERLPCRPVLAGEADAIRAEAHRAEADPALLDIVDPQTSPDLDLYCARLLEIRRRKGLLPAAAQRMVRRPLHFGLMALRSGRVDGLVLGMPGNVPEQLRTLLGVVGSARSGRRACGFSFLLAGDRVRLAADTALHISPDAAELAGVASLAADTAGRFGLQSLIALLAAADFGALRHPTSETVRRAAERLKTNRPDLNVDGEMTLATALEFDRAAECHPHARIRGDAEVLVFPDLASATLATQAAALLGGAETAGPYLAGLDHPVNVLPDGAPPEAVLAIAAVTAALASVP